MDINTYGNTKAAITFSEIMAKSKHRRIYSRRWTKFTTMMKAIEDADLSLDVKKYLYMLIYKQHKNIEDKSEEGRFLNNVISTYYRTSIKNL